MAEQPDDRVLSVGTFGGRTVAYLAPSRTKDKEPPADGPICVDVVGEPETCAPTVAAMKHCHHSDAVMEAVKKAKRDLAQGEEAIRNHHSYVHFRTYDSILHELAATVWDEAEAKGTHDALVGLEAETEHGEEEQPQPKESDAVEEMSYRILTHFQGDWDHMREHCRDLIATVRAADAEGKKVWWAVYNPERMRWKAYDSTTITDCPALHHSAEGACKFLGRGDKLVKLVVEEWVA